MVGGRWVGWEFMHNKFSVNQFGSVFIEDISDIGLENCFLPIPPYSNSSMGITINKTTKEYREVGGKLVEEEILRLNVNGDHRFMDGADVMKLIRFIEKIFENPELIDQ